MNIKKTVCVGFLASFAIAGCDTENVQPRSIEPICVEETDDLAAEDWVCPESLTAECDAVPPEIYFTRSDDNACGSAEYATIEGPFPPGEHRIRIEEEESGELVCAAELTVVDTVPPEVYPATIELWPPNHKMHAILVEDCLEEVRECDPEWEAHFTWVTSDEPANGLGDGDTAEDVRVLSDTAVYLRAERSGTGNGRVYALGLHVEDGSGNETEAVCHVQVPHDQGDHRAIEDDAAYRIEIPPSDEADARADQAPARGLELDAELADERSPL